MNDLVSIKNDEAVCKEKWKHVYVFLADDETVKIGVSKNVEQRIKAIQSTSGKSIVKTFITEKCSNPYKIETVVLSHFSSKRCCGEWIKEDFDTAIAYVKEIYEKESKFELQDNSDYAGAFELIEKMCGISSNNMDVNKKDVLSMTVRDFFETIKDFYESSIELCGEDDEICTIPAKEKYEQMTEIIDYVKDLQRL